MDKKFVGIVRQIKFQNGGSIIKLGVKAEDLREHINQGGWVNLVIAKKKEPKNDGKDFYCYVDEFKPKQDNIQKLEDFAKNETPPTPEEDLQIPF